MPFDFKKEYKELYQPPTVPTIVEVPTMNFIAACGKGDPNTSPEYQVVLKKLYGLSYAIKMNYKHRLDYVVAPLEGWWRVDDPEFKGGGLPIFDKGKFVWIMMIRQPAFVNDEIIAWAKNEFDRKNPSMGTNDVRFGAILGGLFVQMLHLGSYDSEARTVTIIDDFAEQNGYTLDITAKRWHQEIYISDPRRTTPENLKTVIRHPIRKADTL